MGLRDFFFGPRASDEGVLSEGAKHPHAGHVDGGAALAEHLRRIEEAEEAAAGAGKETKEATPRPGYGVPQRYERAADHLRHRLRREHADLIPRWSRQTRKLERYMGALSEAESRREAHQVFRKAWRTGPGGPGGLRKLERKLELAQDSLYQKYEGGEISRGKFLRERGALKRSMRDVRRLGRWR